MPLSLYTDISVHGPLVEALIRAGVDLLRAQDDTMDGIKDETVLDRATVLGRIVLAQDEDFRAIAGQRQASGQPFSTVIYLPQQRLPIPAAVFDIQLVLRALMTGEEQNRVYHLPL